MNFIKNIVFKLLSKIKTNQVDTNNVNSLYNYYSTDSENIQHDAKYAFDIAQNYISYMHEQKIDLRNKNILEIGPGTHFGTIFLLKCMGAAHIAVVDRFLVNYNPSYHSDIYKNLAFQIAEKVSCVDTSIFNECIKQEEHIGSGFSQYHCGLENMHEIHDNNFDIVLSNAVLEHLEDPMKAFNELYRVTAPGGVGFHQVDFRCHKDFSRPLDFLLMDDAERKQFIENAQFSCGNGWRLSEYKKMLVDCGFKIISATPNMLAEDIYFDEFIKKLNAGTSRYRNFSQEDLRALGVLIVTQK